MRIIRSFCFCLASVLAAHAAWALPPETTDPRAIMDAVDKREQGDRGSARMKMTITDKAGASRERAVATRSMDFADHKKQLILFESPADVRNVGLLTVDYDAGEKSDDQWLYLPSLRKSTRISSSDKSGSFMGSDLSYADMTRQSPDQYDFTMVEQNVDVGGEACWLIESRPRTERAKEETGYLKSYVWISKAKLMPVQIKAWIKEGKKLKYLKFSDLGQVDGIWVAKKISARTMQNNDVLSTTTIAFSNMRFKDQSVTENDFTQARLERGL